MCKWSFRTTHPQRDGYCLPLPHHQINSRSTVTVTKGHMQTCSKIVMEVLNGVIWCKATVVQYVSSWCSWPAEFDSMHLVNLSSIISHCVADLSVGSGLRYVSRWLRYVYCTVTATPSGLFDKGVLDTAEFCPAWVTKITYTYAHNTNSAPSYQHVPMLVWHTVLCSTTTGSSVGAQTHMANSD